MKLYFTNGPAQNPRTHAFNLLEIRFRTSQSASPEIYGSVLMPFEEHSRTHS